MKELGDIAYSAYCKATGGVSLVSGEKLPDWESLTPAIQEAWTQAAEAVAIFVTSPADPTDYEDT